jgi:hypothetical protein
MQPTRYHISCLRAFKHHCESNHCIAADIEQLKLDNSLSKIFKSKSELSEEDFVRYEVNGVERKND